MKYRLSVFLRIERMCVSNKNFKDSRGYENESEFENRR